MEWGTVSGGRGHRPIRPPTFVSENYMIFLSCDIKIPAVYVLSFRHKARV